MGVQPTGTIRQVLSETGFGKYSIAVARRRAIKWRFQKQKANRSKKLCINYSPSLKIWRKQPLQQPAI